MRQDLHVHTTWSDGSASPRAMVEHALARGLDRIAITDHSYMQPDEGYCLPSDATAYVAEVRALAHEYAGRIEVLCGIEQDFYSPSLLDAGLVGPRAEDFDYVIGSVHYVRLDDALIAIDDTPEIFERAVRELCGGDYYLLVERYFETVASVVDRTGASAVGHFDLVKKFNEKGAYFDEDHPRYRAAWVAAADALLDTGVPFEINTGGMYRGWRSDPYPSAEIERYLRARGARLYRSSDAHGLDALYFGCE